MVKKTHQFEYLVYSSPAELSVADRDLLARAREAVSSSHAPYSCYHVGAAARLANGQVFTGSNQENMSFPAGLCAERVAVFSAMSACPGVAIEAVAITAVADAFEVKEPVPPCGMCRQAIVEYEMIHGNKIRVILGGDHGKVITVEGMQSLLPLTFHETGIKKGEGRKKKEEGRKKKEEGRKKKEEGR
jgi:cytidine deaminase